MGMSEMDRKCRNYQCDREADEDVASQGYCLRCVAMWIRGIDPEHMLIKEQQLKKNIAMWKALKTIIELSGQACAYEAWDSREQCLEARLNNIKEIALKALESKGS
jgi:hypothetical protein